MDQTKLTPVHEGGLFMRTRWGIEFRLWDSWFLVLTKNFDICHKTGIFGWLRVELMLYWVLPRVNSFSLFFCRWHPFVIEDMGYRSRMVLGSIKYKISNLISTFISCATECRLEHHQNSINQPLLSADQDHHSSLPDDWCMNPRSLLSFRSLKLEAVNLCEMLSVLSSVYIRCLCFDQAGS